MVMFFQHILKGIPKLSPEQVNEIFSKTGLRCNWWRGAGTIDSEQIKEKLSDDNLYWHLERYDEVPQGGDREFWKDTPFISTTAGTAVEDFAARKIYVCDAFWEAAMFATERFGCDGWIFYGYVYVLGKPAVELQEFAEEIRNVHQYARFMRHRREGEFTAKIEIPSVRLRCAEFYRGADVGAQFSRGQRPKPLEVIVNDAYCPPERYANILDAM
jgi:hypothetical protein